MVGLWPPVATDQKVRGSNPFGCTAAQRPLAIIARGLFDAGYSSKVQLHRRIAPLAALVIRLPEMLAEPLERGSGVL